MARIFDEMNLLIDGTKFAVKEAEQLDLVNQIASFCVRHGDIFDSEKINRLENSLVEAIDFGNDIEYTHEKFIPLYQKTLTDYKELANWYFDLLRKNPVISFVLTADKGGEAFVRTMKSLFKYRNTETEIVVMDCTKTGDLKNSMKAFGDIGKIKYYRSEYDNMIVNEIDANMKCTGQFVFPVEEGDQIIIEVIPTIITMLKNNPHAGFITSPGTIENTEIDKGLVWKIAEPETELLFQARDIQHKTGFGYKNEFIDLGKEDVAETLLESCETSSELYRTIAYQLSDIHEAIVFGKPLYSNI